jgi:hypothetical protein
MRVTTDREGDDMAEGTTGPADPDFEAVVFAGGVVVPEQASHRVRDERRGDVVLRHARLTGRGRPTFCSPTRAEQTGVVNLPSGSGTDGKVIYPTREAAEAAARELEGLGARRLRPYLCARSRHGHYHLTTDRTAARLVRRRIPQQTPTPGAVPAQRAEKATGTPSVLGRIPRQAGDPAAVTPLHIPQQRRPA